MGIPRKIVMILWTRMGNHGHIFNAACQFGNR